MKGLKKVGVFLMFLISSAMTLAAGIPGAGGNDLLITKDIEFEVEIGPAVDLDLDPVYIHFGNVVRDSKDTITKTEYLKFKSAFTEDNEVTTSFPEETTQKPDPNYAKFDLELKISPREKEERQAQNPGQAAFNDRLPVYIKKINKMRVNKGEIKIPITAEIREVPADQELGRYYKVIKMNVMTTPINPIGAIRKSGQGGMR